MTRSAASSPRRGTGAWPRYCRTIPAAADELRILVERVRAQVPRQQQACTQHVTATRAGTVIGHQGTGDQRLHYYGTPDATDGRPDQGGGPEPDRSGQR